ncbi:MAG TPA: transporter substrate-binding domain-containing protein [Tissierellia bacterium]|nr:transporter substrate-binding domain-containing protein [Tissierellia bacterium]
MKKIINKSIAVVLILVILLACLPMVSEGARTNIKVAVNCNLPPFQFLDKDGNIIGLHIDIMNEIASKENLIIEYLAFNETSKALEALENGLVDVVLGITSKNDVIKGLRKTNDISSATLCMLVGNENVNKILYEEEQQKYSVAFELGTISFSQLSQLKNARNNLVMGNQKQLYEALVKKQVEAVIGVKESMLYMLENNPDYNSYTIVLNYFSTINYTALTRNNDLVLHNSLNRGISKLRASDTYEQLLDKWIINTEQEAAEEMRAKMLSYIAAFFIIALIVISIISYTNYQLKKVVAEKTKEISKRVQQLETESNLRERLIEFSPAGIMLLKKDGSVLMMNSIMRSLTGIDSIKNKKELNIYDLKIVGNIYKQVSCNNNTIERPVIIKYNNDSENLIFRCYCQSINDENDMVLMVEDITLEEKEKHEIFELRKNKALNRIIAGMAHEIKNPLMSINTFASLIRKQGKDKEFQEMFAQHVPKEVDRINRLINMLINYSRPVRSNKERVSVRELINDSIYFAQLSARKIKHINIKSNENIEAYIFVNRDQIKQAFINLILNSIQSIEEKIQNMGGSIVDDLVISVSSYRSDNKVYLEVYDEGCGIDESDIEKCLDPFFTTKATGLGMGLSLTKQFVEDNFGKIEIESRKNQYTIIRMIFEEDKD